MYDKIKLNNDLLKTSKSNEVIQIKILQAKVVDDLILGGADVNYRDCYDYTPLMYAVYFGNEKLTKVLMNHGAAAMHVNRFGKTACDYAKHFGHIEIEKMLTQTKKILC